MRSKYWPIMSQYAEGRTLTTGIDNHTVCITTDSQLHIVGDLYLHHGGFVVYELLDGQNNLIHVLAMDLLASLEALSHVVNELLCHLLAESHTVVIILHRHAIKVESLSRRGLVAHLDSGEKGQLPHNLLAFL